MAKVAIVGCGAMGSVYAALMADAGHEVHAVTLWLDHAEAMRNRGLRVEGASGDRTAACCTDGIDGVREPVCFSMLRISLSCRTKPMLLAATILCGRSGA